MFVVVLFLYGGDSVTFKEFIKYCANFHIQAEITIVKYDHIIYQGEYCNMPKMIRKHYDIKQFYVTNVTERKIVLYVGLNKDSSDKLYKRLKHKYSNILREANQWLN